MNLATLIARHDPQYMQRAQIAEMQTRAHYDIAYSNNQALTNREHIKGNYALDRQKLANQAIMEVEYFKSEKEDNRLSKTIHAKKEIESDKNKTSLEVVKIQGENAISLEDRRLKNSLELEETRSENNKNLSLQDAQANYSLELLKSKNEIQKMEIDLNNQLAKSGFDSFIAMVHKTVDLDSKKTTSLISQIEARTAIRGRIMEKIADAVIAEKLAQKQHKRDMEKLEKESSLRRFDDFWAKFCGFVMALYENGKNEEARKAIDEQIARWNAGGQVV